MKRTVSKIVLCLFALSLAAFAQPSANILGSWTQSIPSTKWTFRPDGTGFMEVSNTTARFNWTVRGKTLKVFTAGTSVPYRVLESGSDRLVIENLRASKTYQLERN